MGEEKPEPVSSPARSYLHEVEMAEDLSSIVRGFNEARRKLVAAGAIVEGAGEIRSPEDMLEIENRWLRRKIERLQRATSTRID